jgi:PadR family transcriptional regulator, regulatory protein PadR
MGKKRCPGGQSLSGRCIVNPVKDHGRELFFGLIRIHVLLHATHEPIFGLAMMEELGHHGYRIGPGTLYPLLHGLERAGLLKSIADITQGRRRRLYRITPSGRRALEKAREKVDELYEELHEAYPKIRREKS